MTYDPLKMIFESVKNNDLLKSYCVFIEIYILISKCSDTSKNDDKNHGIVNDTHLAAKDEGTE